MEDDEKDEGVVQGLNGVGFAGVEKEHGVGTELVGDPIAAGEEAFSLQNDDVDGGMGGFMLFDELAWLEGETEDTAVLVYMERLGVGVGLVKLDVLGKVESFHHLPLL